MPLVTVTIPTPVLPVGWVFKVELAQQIFGMPLVFSPLADQTNAPFNLILSASGWIIKVTLDMDGILCEPWYYCFRVHPPCTGCPTPVTLSIQNMGPFKYLHVNMTFPLGLPYCGVEIEANAFFLFLFWQIASITSLGQLTNMGGGVYRKTFLLNGSLAYTTNQYTVKTKATCCQYVDLCTTSTING